MALIYSASNYRRFLSMGTSCQNSSMHTGIKFFAFLISFIALYGCFTSFSCFSMSITFWYGFALLRRICTSVNVSSNVTFSSSTGSVNATYVWGIMWEALLLWFETRYDTFGDSSWNDMLKRWLEKLSETSSGSTFSVSVICSLSRGANSKSVSVYASVSVRLIANCLCKVSDPLRTCHRLALGSSWFVCLRDVDVGV